MRLLTAVNSDPLYCFGGSGQAEDALPIGLGSDMSQSFVGWRVSPQAIGEGHLSELRRRPKLC